MRRFYFAFITLLLFSCESRNAYTLKGNAQGFADGTKVFLFEVDETNNGVVKDTLVINSGLFEASYPLVEDTGLQYLKIEGAKANIMYFVENEDLSVQIYADSINASYVIGGKQNELYRDYISSIRNFNQKKVELNRTFQKAQREQDNILADEIRNQSLSIMDEENSYKKSFVTENINSIFGLMLATELHGKGQLKDEETEQLLASLSPKMSQHQMAIDLKSRIESAKRASIGGKAPNFSAPTPEGETLALNDVLGKYTLVDFWASWCRPCRRENPNVVRVYEKFHDNGLNIISVSLDKPGQKDRWLKAIEDDNMNWYHVSNLQFWQDPIARQYNVRSIPATFLLDSEGNIIDKNLRGPALEQKISSLLD